MSTEFKNGKKTSTARIRVKDEELEDAREFLRSNAIGKRFQSAEHLLTLFAKDEDIRRVKRFIFNSSYDLRRIINPDKFEKIASVSESIENLLSISGSTGHLRLGNEQGSIQFYLFYDKDLSTEESTLFSQAFGQIISTVFSSLQFDMSGYHSNEPFRAKTTEKIDQEIKEKIKR
jgi:hypothetical protein